MMRPASNNHPGKVILAIIPFAVLCAVGQTAEFISHHAGRLDFACWRGIGLLERWAEKKERDHG